MELGLYNQDANFFKDIIPALVAVAVRAGTKLQIFDRGLETLNEFAANEIEKADAHIDNLSLK